MMVKCLNCNEQVPQTEGKRKRLYCDNAGKCKSEYQRKNKVKQPKYVQFKTFQALKDKFDKAVEDLNKKPLQPLAPDKEKETPVKQPANQSSNVSKGNKVDNAALNDQIKDLNKELEGIKGSSGIADMRRKLLRKRIAEIKAKLSI